MVNLKFIPILIFTSILYSGNKTPIKALWVVRDHMVKPELIDKAISFAEKNGFNHVFAQIRGRGDSFYDSDFVPKSKLVIPDFDPLKYLINKCKNKEIKVHAWINVYYLWSSKIHPVNYDHLLFQKPDWLDQKEKDKYISNKIFLNNKNDLYINGEGFFLAPTNPNVNKYLIKVIKEISSKYPLDGIHYDYIRYQSMEYGYNRHGLSIFSEKNEYNDYHLTENFDRVFSDYKRSVITEFVKNANIEIKNNLPNCIISAAVKPNIYDAKLTFSQEWDLWLSAGYLDWAVIMNYIVDNNEFVQNMYIIKDNIPKKYHNKIIVGISTYNQGARSAGKKINRLRRMDFNNISIFSYNTMIAKPNYWKRLKKYF